MGGRTSRPRSKLNWFLKKQTRTKREKRYDYYSIVEPYHEDGKNKHKVVVRLGLLTPEQAQLIRDMLQATKSDGGVFYMNAEDLLFEDHWRYLDLAFLNHVWDGWDGLSDVFPAPHETSSTRTRDIATADVAKALTFYRCLDPGSYLSSVEWFGGTACDRILGIDGSHLNESRVYRELTAIEGVKEKLESYLYTTLRERNEESVRVIFYDLSDSYFEGTKCRMARPGRTKADGFRTKKIVLSLLVNSEGYPFAWEVMEGDTADVTTLAANADRWKQQFDLSRLIMVFDRGMVSDDNLVHLEDSKTYLYITALDKNQIGGVPGVGLERFKGITEENAKSAIVELGFKRYDDRAYYEDLGATKREDGDSRRHVLVFNPELFKDERRQREERIRKAQEYMKEEGESLLKAKRSRQRKPTEQRIDSRLKELRARRYIRYELEETELEGGTRTFRLRYSRETEAIGKAELTDGLCVLVTNITDETEPKKYRLGPPELIKAYRDKYRAEDAFRDLKSFIKFQPTFVYTDEHVRAHYTICVLSYLLDVTVTNRLRESPIEGVGSVREVYKLLERGRIGELKVRGSDRTVMKLVTPRAKEKEVLDLFGCEYLIGRKHLKSMLAE